jgi:hypothetical protein
MFFDRALWALSNNTAIVSRISVSSLARYAKVLSESANIYVMMLVEHGIAGSAYLADGTHIRP